MANRFFVTGQVFIEDDTTTTDLALTRVAVAGDTVITVDGGAGDFKIHMANGTTGTVTSGTANVTGSPLALVAGENVITVDGNGTATLNLTLGTGADTDDVNSWSAASGGRCGASVPIDTDDTKFDALSYSDAVQIAAVTSVQIAGLDCTGAIGSASIAAGTALQIGGDATFDPNMEWESPGIGIIRFAATGTQEIRFNGLSMGVTLRVQNTVKTVFIDRLESHYTAADTALAFYDGHLEITANVELARRFSMPAGGAKTLELHDNVIRCSSWLRGSVDADVVLPNTATLELVTGDFNGGALDYAGLTVAVEAAAPTVDGGFQGLSLEVVGAGVTIADSNSFDKLTADRIAAAKTVTLTAGTTQTTEDFAAAGAFALSFVSSIGGTPAHMRRPGGKLVADLTGDITATDVDFGPDNAWRYRGDVAVPTGWRKQTDPDKLGYRRV